MTNTTKQADEHTLATAMRAPARSADAPDSNRALADYRLAVAARVHCEAAYDTAPRNAHVSDSTLREAALSTLYDREEQAQVALNRLVAA